MMIFIRSLIKKSNFDLAETKTSSVKCEMCSLTERRLAGC
jgi:hypothetical protein